MRKQIQRA